MVPAEDDKQSTRRWGHENQPVLSETIGVQKTSSELLIPDLVLLILVDTIQDREIEIG